MSVNLYNVKKWIRMITGTSIEHVNQGVGKIYSISAVRGYYNDLIEKVIKSKGKDKTQIPLFTTSNKENIYFSIAIFQYGLGAYDLYLIENNNLYYKVFKNCVEWAIENQLENGAWNTFLHSSPKHPYSSMAQGEGISLLVRAYIEFKDELILKKIQKAIDLLILPIEEGGTTFYDNDQVFFQEFTDKPTVLNGWIFTLFGLLDYLKIVENEKVLNIYQKSLDTLENSLRKFDIGYWSKYDILNMIASPFYHKLHISLLSVLYELTGRKMFFEYYKSWSCYQMKLSNRIRAFTYKAWQKIKE